LIRVTITDREQTVSFLTTRETALRLVAGCSVDPASLGELLIAADVYQRGLAAAVMADLMEFDKRLRQQGAGPLQAAIRLSRERGELFQPAFQVVDELSGQEACQPRGAPLVVIDLARRAIQHAGGFEIDRSAEVGVEAGREAPIPTVTYILPENWTIQAL
jgi:hypothetical protein